MSSSYGFYVFLFMTMVVINVNHSKMWCGADPTDGFTNMPLTQANFEIQKPYDVPLDQRYTFQDGVHRLWVYADDKPHEPNSDTQPRTEIRIRGLDYTSGVWQFEGYVFVPKGTSGATIAQIFGGTASTTTFLLRIFSGDLWYYSISPIATGFYDKWFRVNLIHDTDKGQVSLFIDGVQAYQVPDRGPGTHYFKCGVYAAPSNFSYYMESRWRDIKVYKKE